MASLNGVPFRWTIAGQRLLYGFLVGIATWYAVMTPIAWTGTWVSNMIPSLQMFIQWFHVYLIIGIWALGASRRATVASDVTVALTVFMLSTFVFNGDPGLFYLAKWGWHWYLYNWFLLVFPVLGGPALAGFLLLRADRIAPRILKNWRPLYG